MINTAWNMPNNSLTEKFDFLTTYLKNWNKDVFGNIFRNKRNILARIEGIQKARSLQYSHNLFLLEKDLIKQFNDILK